MYFFFHDTATTEIYTLSLHDALPIYADEGAGIEFGAVFHVLAFQTEPLLQVFFIADKHVAMADNLVQNTNSFLDRKSTRLNSSHSQISYAVFCLKKKNKIKIKD